MFFDTVSATVAIPNYAVDAAYGCEKRTRQGWNIETLMDT
jgi:hypothetical protein